MKLTEVVPWGRSLAEYQAMFALTESNLQQSILGVGDGPASFNAELTATGGRIVSIDPIYAFSAEEIRQRVEQTSDAIAEQVRQNSHQYIWTTFRNADDLCQYRLATMEQFLADYPVGVATGRYVSMNLPRMDELPDQSFDLALVSHLLFLYSEQLSERFHIESVINLLRVAREIRIFPLLTLSVKESPYVDSVLDHVTRTGHTAELAPVTYEFQRGGNRMMVIRRRF